MHACGRGRANLLNGMGRVWLMPIVHVYVWTGFSNEAKKKVIAGITKLFTEINVPGEAVEVVIHEVPKENWGVGGEQASEKLKQIQPP